MPRIPEATRRLWMGRLMGGAGIAAIAGITLALQGLGSALMDAGLNPAGVLPAIIVPQMSRRS